MLVNPDVTRRGFLKTIAAAFTAITNDFVWLMRWCSFNSGLRYAGAG